MALTSLKNTLALAVLLSGVVATQNSLAADCSPFLKNLQTTHSRFGSLCSLAQRYQTALQTLRAKGVVEPERISDLIAPRLIDLPDWVQNDAKVKFDPVNFYQPAPTTWITWEKGAAFVNNQIIDNRAKQAIAPLTLDWIERLHVTTMTGVMSRGKAPGVLRQTQEVGRSLLEKSAMTQAQVKEMSEGSGYKSLIDPSRPLMTWQPKVCFEQLDPQLQKVLPANMLTMHWPDADPNAFVTMPDGQKKQCGNSTYADLQEIVPQLHAWFDYVNAGLTEINTTHSLKQDPAEFFARIQRWFIVIHPFSDGNGRMSRFALELVAESMGLPPPIFAEMNDDITTPEAQWADQVVDGFDRSVHIAEACAVQPTRAGCNVLPKVIQ